MNNNRRFYSLLSALLLFGFAIRLASINHGLPEMQVVDENSDLSTALRLNTGEIPERHVRYHRMLIAYVDAVAAGGLFGYTTITGQVRNLDQLRDLYFSDRWMFTLATRVIMAGLTTLTIFFVALTGRYFGDRVGLSAALVLALNGFFTLNSLYATPDALVPVFLALCLWLTLRLHKYRRGHDYALAGISVALVMLAKLSAATVAVGVLVAHAAIMGERHKTARSFIASIIDRKLLLFVIGAIVGNILFNPLAFIHLDDLVFEIQRLSGYAYNTQELSISQILFIVGAHVSEMAAFAWRWTLPLSILGFAAVASHRKEPIYWIILCVFITSFLGIANVVTPSYKIFYWMPWLIPMALTSALGMEWLLGWGQRLSWKVTSHAFIAVLLVLEGGFLLQLISKKLQKDTRQLALEYIIGNWPPETRVMSGDPLAYSVPLRRDETSILRAIDLGATNLEYWRWWLSLPESLRLHPVYNLYGPELQNIIDDFDDVRRVIQQEGIEYVVEADLCRGDRMLPESQSALAYPPMNEGLREELDEVMVFSPFTANECVAPIDDRTGMTVPNALSQQVRPGPLVRIYRVRLR